MSSAVTEIETEASSSKDNIVVNNAVIKIATTNGSGSQSANLILLRAIFKMGIPVSGKNLFPSNIAGLPTWFTIRVNEDGWLAQRTKTDIAILMNPQTVMDDMNDLDPGSIVIVNDSLKGLITRDDLDVYPVPFDTLVKEASTDTRFRKKVINVIYVGVFAWLLDMDLQVINDAVDQQFGSKPAAANMNKDAATVGYEWAAQTLKEKLSFRLERRTLTENKIIIEGNEASAMGLLFGGVTVLAWYPITPSSSVCENLTTYLQQYRMDPKTGKATFAVIQAEDEIASIGIVLGAGWAGARACTATSGPGLSLMAEMAGLSYFAEIPAVIVDVQRMGPSTGLPTRTAQSDITSALYLSHGDTKHVLLIPGTMEECYEFSRLALDLAEQLQTLIIVMSDLDLGMNKWMSDPFTPPSDTADKRGKVLSLDELNKAGGFDRYADVDDDGIPYRTLPGTPHPNGAYFTRGTGHNTKAQYSEKSEDWLANMDRLSKKYETARHIVPKPVVQNQNDTLIGIIGFGSSDPAIEEARHLLKTDRQVTTNYLRLRALPVNGEVEEFIESHDTLYVVEQNRDAQMAAILKSEYPELAYKLRSILHYDGMPIDAEGIVSKIMNMESA